MKKILILLFLILLIPAGLSGCKKQSEELTTVYEKLDSFDYSAYLSKVDETVTIDYNVFKALELLQKVKYSKKVSDYLTTTDITSYLDGLDLSSPSNSFKASVIGSSYSTTFKTKLDNALNGYTETDINAWNYTYTSLALRKENVNSTLKETLDNKLIVINAADYRDADYAGYALMALSDNKTIDKTSLYTLIDESLKSTGIESFGSVNACSTASAVLGLIASGNDPSDYKGVNLINCLLSFWKADGIYYTLDGTVDTFYSTPQVYAALATYAVYKEKGKAISLF